MRTIIYGNGKYLALANYGVAFTSADGNAWTQHDVDIDNWDNQMIYENGKFIRVGFGGVILYSLDGMTWSERVIGLPTWLGGVTYGNGLYVAVGGDYIGKILTSIDGVSWTEQNIGASAYLGSVVYGNGRYIAVGDEGTILTSTDGNTWASQTIGNTDYLAAVIYANGRYVAVGYDEEWNGIIVTSQDGITWISQNVGVDIVLEDITYGNGKYIAVGSGYDETIDNYCGVLFVSTDGVTWNRQNMSGNWMYGITYGNGKYIAAGYDDQYNDLLLSSTDGTTWAQQTHEHIREVTYRNGTFILSTYDEDWNQVLEISTDGISWTQIPISSYGYIKNITYGKGKYIAVGYYGEIFNIVNTGSTLLSPPTFNTSTPEPTSKTVTIIYHPYSNIKEYKIGNTGTWTDYLGPLTITANCVIFARCDDSEASLTIDDLVAAPTPETPTPETPSPTPQQPGEGYEEGTYPSDKKHFRYYLGIDRRGITSCMLVAGNYNGIVKPNFTREDIIDPVTNKYKDGIFYIDREGKIKKY